VTTIGDVAREAGVSRSTVSSVLTGRKFVTPKTRQRIEAAIEQLQFSVNAGARALATARTMTIGVVVHLHQGVFEPALAAYLFALSDAAREYGYSIMLLTDPDDVRAVRDAIAGRRVDGLILLDVVDDDPRLALIEAKRFPATLIGMPEQRHGIDAVDLDFAAAAAMLIDHLAEAGHTEVMFVTWPAALYQTGSTYAVRFAASARAQAAIRRVRLLERPVSVDPVAAHDDLIRLIADPGNPRALLVHNDTAAVVLPAVLHELGLRLPDDRSVVSLHSAELARFFTLDITSVASEPFAASSLAVTLLMRRLADPDAPAETRLIQPSLNLKGSAPGVG
jgi:DNA-binding LacI/PurR family transcriptional regulator